VNTKCGASVCLKGLKATCPPNTVTVGKFSDPSKELSGLLTKLGSEEDSDENTLMINDASPAVSMVSYFDSKAKPDENTAFVGFTVS